MIRIPALKRLAGRSAEDPGVIRIPALKSLAGRSIAVRLAASAVFWSFVILLIAALILSALYREATERAFDQRLLVYANNLASDLVSPGDPDRDLSPVGDPRFELPLSGWYWQVGPPGASGRALRYSKSLFGAALPGLVPLRTRTGASARSARATAMRPTSGGCASSSATSTSARTAGSSFGSRVPRTRSMRISSGSACRWSSRSCCSGLRSASRPCSRSASACSRS